eukprot:3507997-Prymnesium_polylepis.1
MPSQVTPPRSDSPIGSAIGMCYHAPACCAWRAARGATNSPMGNRTCAAERSASEAAAKRQSGKAAAKQRSGKPASGRAPKKQERKRGRPSAACGAGMPAGRDATRLDRAVVIEPGPLAGSFLPVVEHVLWRADAARRREQAIWRGSTVRAIARATRWRATARAAHAHGGHCEHAPRAHLPWPSVVDGRHAPPCGVLAREVARRELDDEQHHKLAILRVRLHALVEALGALDALDSLLQIGHLHPLAPRCEWLEARGGRRRVALHRDHRHCLQHLRRPAHEQHAARGHLGGTGSGVGGLCQRVGHLVLEAWERLSQHAGGKSCTFAPDRSRV